MDCEDQPAASQMSEMDTSLDHAQEEVMTLVDWALTPMGHCNPKEEYANVIASINHLSFSFSLIELYSTFKNDRADQSAAQKCKIMPKAITQN